jgi:hypothetical protein
VDHKSVARIECSEIRGRQQPLQPLLRVSPRSTGATIFAPGVLNPAECPELAADPAPRHRALLRLLVHPPILAAI